MTASTLADICYNWDLSTTDGARRWREMVERDRPLCVVIGFPCTNWCNFSKINYAHRRGELEALRQRDRRMLRLMVWTMLKQHHEGRYFMFENPPTSAIWGEAELSRITSLKASVTGKCDACAFGLMNTQQTIPLWKQYRWLSNSSTLIDAVCVSCPGHRVHDSVSGSQTKLSGVYPVRLAQAISRAVRSLKP